jgi:hypothetical protein
MEPMNQTILQAFDERRRMRCRYHDTLRVIEPQCYGISTAGTEALRVHQIQGWYPGRAIVHRGEDARTGAAG